jgi:hypothetical protein
VSSDNNNQEITKENNNLLTPKLNNISMNFGNQSPKEELLSEDDLDLLINSQVETEEAEEPIPPVPPVPPATEKEESEKEEISTKPKNEDNVLHDFDLTLHDGNLLLIREDALKAINALKIKQKVLDGRTNLIEKFILLDEKDLAIQITKNDPNLSKIGQIQRSISSRTELLSQIFDISLKFEDTILKWYKTLMDIEKDKVSAYHKIKTINKEIKDTDTDINEVLNDINNLVNSKNSDFATIAKNELSVGGYGGKPYSN